MTLQRLFLLLSVPTILSIPAFSKDSSGMNAFDSFFRADKGHHFAASAVTCALVHYSAVQEFGMSGKSSLVLSVGIAFTAGAAKEMYDKSSGKGHASWQDLAADVAGIALATVLLNLPFN